MHLRPLVVSLVLAAACFAPELARADVPPPDSCTGAGTACNNAGPNADSPGTCTDTTCTKINPSDGGTYEYACTLCMATDSGAAGAGGGTGTGGASATGGSTATGGGSSSSSDDGGCAVVAPGVAGGAALASALGLLGLGLLARRRRAG